MTKEQVLERMERLLVQLQDPNYPNDYLEKVEGKKLIDGDRTWVTAWINEFSRKSSNTSHFRMKEILIRCNSLYYYSLYYPYAEYIISPQIGPERSKLIYDEEKVKIEKGRREKLKSIRNWDSIWAIQTSMKNK